jgi:Protein of unknown function (DUF2845)
MKRCLPLLLLLCPGLSQAEAMRCGNKLVYEGDEMAVVEARCGKPVQVTHSYIMRIPSYWYHGRRFQLSDEEVQVPVETWVYNFGSRKLMRKLRFEDGVLIEITTLGDYGYTPE